MDKQSQINRQKGSIAVDGSGSLEGDLTDQEVSQSFCSDLGLHERVNQDHPPCITHSPVDDLAGQDFPQPVVRDPSLIQEREARVWAMRGIVLGVAVGWIILGTSASILLFLFTKSNLALLPIATTPLPAAKIIDDISRFLFWRQEDYKLENLKQILKMKKWKWLKSKVRQKPKA